MNTELVTGDTGSTLELTVRDSSTNAVVDLTGASVKLRWMGATSLTEVYATVTDPVNGVCEYTFSAGQIAAPTMRVEVEVTDSGGSITTGLDLIVLKVRPQVG